MIRTNEGEILVLKIEVIISYGEMAIAKIISLIIKKDKEEVEE